MRRARAELRAELEFRPTTSTCPRAWQKLFVARACARGMSKMSGFASQYRIGRQRVLPMDHHTRLARNLKQLGEVEPGCPRTLMTSSSPFGASIHGGIDWLLDDRGGRRFQLGQCRQSILHAPTRPFASAVSEAREMICFKVCGHFGPRAQPVHCDTQHPFILGPAKVS